MITGPYLVRPTSLTFGSYGHLKKATLRVLRPRPRIEEAMLWKAATPMQITLFFQYKRKKCLMEVSPAKCSAYTSNLACELLRSAHEIYQQFHALNTVEFSDWMQSYTTRPLFLGTPGVGSGFETVLKAAAPTKPWDPR